MTPVAGVHQRSAAENSNDPRVELSVIESNASGKIRADTQSRTTGRWACLALTCFAVVVVWDRKAIEPSVRALNLGTIKVMTVDDRSG